MTMNAHCPLKKVNPAFRYQGRLAYAGNRAAEAAAEEIGAPLLNWNGFFLRLSDTCALSFDGVHVREWVDLIRARFLLSYLCQGPPAPGAAASERSYGGVPSQDPLALARRFDRVAARCPFGQPQPALVANSDVGPTDGAMAPVPGARQRPPLNDEEIRNLANSTEMLRRHITQSERLLRVRVPVWVYLAVNRSCIEE
jgi:hypothetical protein